jgi:hypothetical protein
MSSHRTWRRLFAAVSAFALFSGFAQAEDNTVVKVEEDWELVISEPSPESDAPQVTCVISPYDGAQSVHAAFELNHRSLPSFVAGGLQLQAWNYEHFITRDSAATGELSTPGETITWTMKMKIQDGYLFFYVRNGASTTWGEFGGYGDLTLTIPWSLPSLAGYSPETSVSQSGVGYASNRVSRLVLKEVRYYNAANELVARDTTPRVVHTLE